LDHTDDWAFDVLESEEEVLMIQMLFNVGTAESSINKDKQHIIGLSPDKPLVMLCSRDPKLSEKSYSELVQSDSEQ